MIKINQVNKAISDIIYFGLLVKNSSGIGWLLHSSEETLEVELMVTMGSGT